MDFKRIIWKFKTSQHLCVKNILRVACGASLNQWKVVPASPLFPFTAGAYGRPANYRVCSTRRVGRWGVCTIVRTKRISLMWTTSVPVCVNFTNSLSFRAGLRSTISALTPAAGAPVRRWVPQCMFLALSGRPQPFRRVNAAGLCLRRSTPQPALWGCGWGRRRGRCTFIMTTLRNGGVDAKGWNINGINSCLC